MAGQGGNNIEIQNRISLGHSEYNLKRFPSASSVTSLLSFVTIASFFKQCLKHASKYVYFIGHPCQTYCKNQWWSCVRTAIQLVRLVLKLLVELSLTSTFCPMPSSHFWAFSLFDCSTVFINSHKESWRCSSYSTGSPSMENTRGTYVNMKWG